MDEAARLIWQHDASVAVIEGGRTIGVITARDVCMWAYATGEPLWAIPVTPACGAPVCVQAVGSLPSATHASA